MELPKLSMPAFPHIQASIFVNRPVLLVIFAMFFIVYAVITWVLMYHWSAYGMKSQGILVTETLFLFVSAVLFVVAGFGIYYF